MDKEELHYNDLIVRWLSDDITPENAAELQQWIRADKAHEAHFRQMKEIWSSAGASRLIERYEKDKDGAYKAFALAVKREEAKVQREESRKRFRLPYVMLRLAGAVAALCIVAYFSYKQGSNHIVSQLTTTTVQAPLGSTSSTVLPDGTRVWLNAGSKLSYSQRFGLSDRKVTLTGQAWFSVKHDARKPFTVSSSSLSVTVLGTEFDVRDYDDDNTAEVNLEKGRVLLSNLIKRGERREMSSGDRIVLDKTTGTMTETGHNQTTASQWRKGAIVLDGEPIDDVAKKLERYYNVKVVISNTSLYKLHLHATFFRESQSLTDVLNSLSATKKLNYQLKDGKVILY